MSDQATPASQQPDRDELAAMRRELAAVHARLDRVTRRPTRRRLFARFAPLGIVALLVALLPLSLLAANPFTDLNPGSVHNANIDAIFNAGITTGCDPGIAYCPNDNVTREEMASFLARTAGLGANPPVANAKTALKLETTPVGATSYAANELVRVARNSRDSGEPTGINATTLTEYFTVNITTPTSGFVYLTGSVEILNPAAVACTAQMRLRHAAVESPQAFTTLNPASLNYETLTQTYIFPVSGAGVKTLAMDVAYYATPTVGCTLNFFDPTLTALYVPFGSTGAETLETTGSASGDQAEPQGLP